MATFQGVNVNTGVVELPKFNATGVTNASYIASVTTALASSDVVVGPVIPAYSYVTDVVADVDDLDSAGSPAITFQVGWINSGTTTAAGFIASGNTTAQTGGVARANVAGTLGRVFTNDVTVVATIQNAAGTAVAGKFRLGANYTTSP